MKKILGVDLDEVLSETVDSVLKHNNYMLKGIPIAREDLATYNLWDLPKFNASLQEGIIFFQWLINSPWDFNPVVWAKTALKMFKKKWWKVVIVTAREDKTRFFTEQWVQKYFAGLFDEILFANHFTKESKDKSELCKEAGIEVMIEDNLDYAVELAAKGIKVYLLDKPWNQGYDPEIHKNIVKVKGWKEIGL